MATLVREYDWSATPGLDGDWPRGLRAVVDLILAAPVPMILLWGPKLVQVYNDGYAEIAGAKHPGALGQETQECWPEVWDFNAPIYAAVLDGESRSFKEQKLTILRHGMPENAWFDLTYSPVRDELGRIAGVLVMVIETTAQVRLTALLVAEKETVRRANLGLAAEGRTLRALFQQAPSFICVLRGPDHVFEIVNDAYSQLIGHRDVIGLSVQEALPELEAAGQAFLGLLDTAYATGEAFTGRQMPFKVQRQPGSPLETCWVDLVYQPITDAEGRVTGLFVEGSDVTEAKLATDALRASEEFSRSILASSLDCVKVLDLDGTIQFMSDGGRRVMELDQFAAVIGCPWPDIWQGQTHLDALSAMAVARSGGTGRFQGFAPTAKSKSCWWDVVLTPIPGPDGTPGQLLSMSRDITPLLEMKQALAESEAKFQTITDVMPQMVWSARADGQYDYYNRRWYEFTGTQPGDAHNEAWHSLLHPDDLQAAVAAWRHSLATGKPYEAEHRLRSAGGAWRWCLGRALPMRDAVSGDIQRWFGTCTDIQDLVDARNTLALSRVELERRVTERTAELSQALLELRTEVLEREEAEAALRQSQKMEAVGQLTGGIAHDFNNLLQGISGSMEMLQLRIGQGRATEAGRFVAGATAGVQRAAALTHRLLAYSRKQALDPKQVDANRLVVGMEDLVRRTVGPGIEVVVLLSGELWPTLCDAHQLENALLNLAINARDAMPDGGRLTIETANASLDDAYARSQGDGLESGQYVSLSVTDTGTGMPADVIKRAFEPFYTTKPIGQGTGLGLSMLYGFAKQSRGHARIYSETGYGATVRLYLPRDRSSEVKPEPGPAIRASASRAGTGSTVLLVEDETAVRLLVAEVLRDLGYQVLEAQDGPSGMDALQSASRVDLLITDVGLPGMNGRELAEAARGRQPGLKVLFITGYAHNAAVGQGAALEPGMALLSKPFAFAALATKVQAMIEG